MLNLIFSGSMGSHTGAHRARAWIYQEMSGLCSWQNQTWTGLCKKFKVNHFNLFTHFTLKFSCFYVAFTFVILNRVSSPTGHVHEKHVFLWHFYRNNVRPFSATIIENLEIKLILSLSYWMKINNAEKMLFQLDY